MTHVESIDSILPSDFRAMPSTHLHLAPTSGRLRVLRDHRIGAERPLDDAPIQGVALLHADVEQVEGVLEAVEGLGELLLAGPAGSLEGRGPGLREALDRPGRAVEPLLDVL